MGFAACRTSTGRGSRGCAEGRDSLAQTRLIAHPLFLRGPLVCAHPQKLRLAGTIKTLFSRFLFSPVTSINGTRALIGTVPEATRADFWATQPGLLNPRIRHAYRNHSDYPTRITMQMLVNSHVPARSALPPSPTPRDCLVLKWCTRSSPPSMLIFAISHPSLRPLGSYSCAFRRKKKDTAKEGLEFVELHQSTELVSSSTYLGYLARNEKNEERLIGANAFWIP